MGEIVEMVAKFFKFTPKKARYNGEVDGISVSIYVKKDTPVPAELRIKLINEERR